MRPNSHTQKEQRYQTKYYDDAPNRFHDPFHGAATLTKRTGLVNKELCQLGDETLGADSYRQRIAQLPTRIVPEQLNLKLRDRASERHDQAEDKTNRESDEHLIVQFHNLNEQ